MREILYRGKPVTDTYDEYAGEYLFRESSFVHGSLVFDGKRPIIVGEVVETDPEYVNLAWWVMVKPETVGQYAGLHDVAGTKVFAHDIVSASNCFYEKYVVEWSQKLCSFIVRGPVTGSVRLLVDCEDITVLGNIHDNPELLEVE